MNSGVIRCVCGALITHIKFFPATRLLLLRHILQVALDAVRAISEVAGFGWAEVKFHCICQVVISQVFSLVV